ncbi:MAG: acyl carrier protein [Chloroflexi bacterium]|nr:acyl carrier protein [Chloroflexota bacterium]
MREDTNEIIRRFIIQNFLFDDATAMLPDDASLLETGVVDSTGVLDLIMFTEETFGILVADEDVTPENFDSVSSVAAYVQAKRAA